MTCPAGRCSSASQPLPARRSSPAPPRRPTRRRPPLPDGLANLDFDGWRDIRFKSDKPLLGQEGANFRLELFHLGFLYKRPVTINVLRDGIPAPIPYAANLFDYGHTKLGPMPVNLGFAGFRL